MNCTTTQIPGNLRVVGLDDVGGFGTGANLSTAAFSGIFDARYNPSLERVAFVHQLINTFRIDTFDFG